MYNVLILNNLSKKKNMILKLSNLIALLLAEAWLISSPD